jgi:ubiquinol-cytochrome c reductase iron-sulfur subunit
MSTEEDLSTLAPGSKAYLNDPSHFGIDPGMAWPEDVPRDQDDTKWRFQDDPKGARRAELKIAALWIITLLCGLGLAVTYCLGGQPQVEGSCLCVGFGTLGIGLVLWARDLLPGKEVIASRGHHDQSPESARVGLTQSLGRMTEPLARRPFLGKVLGAVGGVFAICILFPLASLGPRVKTSAGASGWGKNDRLVDEDGRPIRAIDIEANGILTVFPESNPGAAQGGTLLINLGAASDELDVPKNRQGWNVPGPGGTIVAFSKICTHAGCPVGLYNSIAHQLICPCHQSTFDVLSDCKPVFGPAPRSLPQLPLAVDSAGYLITPSGYTVPVGPGYWNRG